MEYQNTRTCFKGVLFSLLLLVLQAFTYVSAQCPILVGGSDFYDKSHSDTIWAGNLNLIETLGPDGSKFSSSLLYADSAQAFMNEDLNVYAVTSNPHLLDSTYVNVDKNMLAVHIANNKDTAVGANTKLFSYRIPGIEKGSSFKVTFTLWCLNDTLYGLGAKAARDDYRWAIEAGIDLDQYGASSCKVKDAYRFGPAKSVEVTLEGTLPATHDYIQLDMITGYNYMYGMTLGISDLRVYGCYKPHVKSSQGIEICRGEQALISLDKDYHASSYKWFKSIDGGKTFSAVGSGKNLYEEIKEEKASYFCLVNGINSDTINIKTIVCCVDANNNPMSRMDVFYDDFGYFDDLRSYTDAFGKSSTMPATYAPERADVTFDLSATGMKFDASGQINDGFYGVVVPTPTGYYQDISGNSRAEWMSGVSSDHSSLISGKTGGGALFMNITKMFRGTIFSRQIDGLCTGKNIYFETYIANMSGGTDPEVTINIKDAVTGTLLATDKAVATKDAGWIRVHIDELKVTASSIILEIESTGGAGDNSGSFWEHGNDLIIDDIRFMVCSPPNVDIYSNLESFASDTVICANTDFEIGTQVSDLLVSFFNGKQNYLYQHSVDGKVWENMGDITDKSSYTFNTEDYPADTNHFRVVVAAPDALKSFLTNPSDANYDDKCRNYSISKSFKIIRAGAIDMGKDVELSECGGVEINMNGSNDGTLVRWGWEDGDGKVLVATTNDEAAKLYTYKVTEDAKFTFVGYNSEGCMGRRKFEVTKKNTVEFTVDTVMECNLTTAKATVTPATAEFKWIFNGTELTETGSSVELDTANGEGVLKAVANAAGYCESDTVSTDIAFHKTPEIPTTLKTEAFEQVKANASFSYVTLLNVSGDVQWSKSETGPWSSVEPKQSLDAPGVFPYYVRSIADGCPSEPVLLTLTVNETPVPVVRNDTVCIGTKIDFTKYVLESDPDYTLVWYNTEDGKGTTNPQPYTATIGGMVLEYWVSQKNEKAESEKARIQIVVPNVATPKVPASDITYCLNDDAEELTATISANPRAYIYADDEVEWRIGDEVVTDLLPSTATPGLTEYTAYGKFTHPTALNGDLVCYGKPVSVSVGVLATPEPTSATNPEFTVTYMKSDGNATTGFADIYTASVAKVAVTDGPDYSLVWYDADGNKLPSAPTPPYIEDQEDDMVYNYFVSQIDADGCESEKVPVVVYVNATPAPIVRDTVICSGETFSLADKVTSNGAGFQILWYDSEADNTPDVAAPALTVTKPGEYQYYVSQKSPEGAESRKVAMTVTLVGVLEPKVLVGDVTYCSGSQAQPISVMAEGNVDAAFYMADAELVWKSEGVTPVAATTVPSTNVATSTVYTYAVNQVYTIPSSGAVCKGEPVSVTVNVTVVDVPGGTHTANYLKTDAADNNGAFKNLMDQTDNNVAVALPGNTLKWYDENKAPLTSVPAPKYDASLQGDAEFTYYVSQVDANGCESELVPVTATVSSTPMPTTSPVAYCEGDDAVAPLTAQITLVGNGDAVTDYTLVWYSENPNNLATEAEKAALALSSAPTASNKVTNGETYQVYTYYVAQKRTNADGKEVVSRAAALIDTVYARPILTVDNPAPVCKPATVDLSNNNLWTVKAAKLYAKAWFDNSMSSSVANPTAIGESGEYYVQASFDVRGKECASDLAKITVEVDYIDDLAIDGPVTTCPNTSVVLKATTSGIYPSAASYTWSSDETGENKTLSSTDFTTSELAGPAGKTYIYKLSAVAGACNVDAVAKHVVTIGDGPIVGTVSFEEVDNRESKTINASTNGVMFYSCGNDVTITSALTSTEDDFVWTLNGSPVGKGASIKVNPAAGTSMYRMTYTNGCPTGFDVTIVNVPVSAMPTNTAYNICEGEDFTAELNVTCPENTFQIAWYRDGELVAGESSKVLSFSPATADKNGVYSYEVTNRGCSVKGEIANGNPLKVRPYIKASAQPLYVARRDSMLSIPLNITVPAGTNPSTIKWTENGIEFKANVNPLQFNVTADHNFEVRLSDDDYCDATVNVEVRADARLKLKISLDDQMCAGEQRDLIIDTLGTGAFVYPSAAGLEVIENSIMGERVYTSGWTLGEDKKLHMPVRPSSDATYSVRFFYRKGEGVEEQIAIKSAKITVLEPINLVAPDVNAYCGDGQSEVDVALKIVYPSGVELTWDDDPTIISSLNVNSITIVPTFDPSVDDNMFMKTYTVHGRYSICSEVIIPVVVRIDRPLEGTILAPEVICEGASATIDATGYSATTYEWTSDIDSSAMGKTSGVITVSPAASSVYELYVTRGACSANDEYYLAVSERPSIVSVDSVSYNSRDIMASKGTTPYMYWIDNKQDSASANSLISNIQYGRHMAHIVDAAGCVAEKEFVVLAPEIKIPILISPNGDGVNEEFNTDIIRDAFPDAVIRVYDRWGKLLVTYKGADPGWNGIYNGNPMPSTDYWYEIEVKELKKTFTGHFTLMRQ